MPDESLLRDQARAMLRAGTVPSRRPDRMWGGPGDRMPCTICCQPIEREQLEYEIEFGENGDHAAPEVFHLHPRCFAAWEFERRPFEHGDETASAANGVPRTQAGQ